MHQKWPVVNGLGSVCTKCVSDRPASDPDRSTLAGDVQKINKRAVLAKSLRLSSVAFGPLSCVALHVEIRCSSATGLTETDRTTCAQNLS